MRRVAQVAFAVAVIAVVAVLARPSVPDLPEEFTIERVTPTPATPAPTSAPTPAPRQVDGPERSDLHLVVQPLDRATLEPLDVSVGFALEGSGGASDMSADGVWMLVSEIGSGPDDPSVVALVDASRPDLPQRRVGVAARVSTLRAVPDGDGFVWLGLVSDVRSVGATRFEPDTAAPVVADPVPLPADLEILDVAALGRDRAGVFGYTPSVALDPRTGEPLPGGHARVLVVDLAAGSVADLDLPAVPVHVGETRGVPSRRDVRPAVAWDGARDRAYVAHADRDAVSVIDLAAGAVTDVLGDEAVPGVRAPTPGTRTAVLAPDGASLYVGGTRPAVDSPRPEPLTLLAYDLVEGRALEREHFARGRIAAVSPGGELLLLDEVRAGPRADEYLAVVETPTFEERWREPSGAAGAAVAFTVEGDIVTLQPEQPMLVPFGSARVALHGGADGAPLGSHTLGGRPVQVHGSAGLVAVLLRPAGVEAER